MSISSVLTHRIHQWRETLAAHGYLIIELTVYDSRGSLEVRAVRSALHGGPPTTIDIKELWVLGVDPYAAMPALDGCHLHQGSWHAQIGGGSALDAERLDVHRSKPAPLIRHRHPHGQPNAVREPTTISTPGAWLECVETTVSTLYPSPDEPLGN